jgi:CHAD domain-containing protein
MFQTCLLKQYQLLCEELQDHFAMAVEYFDPDGVHDLRVGIKRLRAFFRLIEAITPAFPARKNLRKTRRLFKAAGELRDVHVQQELTRNWAKEFGLPVTAYYNSLKHQELQARRRFRTFVESFDLSQEFRKNQTNIRRTLRKVSPDEAAANARARIEQLIGGIIIFGRQTGLQEASLHKIRIQAKESRYTVEFTRACFPKLGYDKTLIRQLRGLHQVLGQWHDDEVALEYVQRFHQEGSSAPAEQAYEHLVSHLQQEKRDLFLAFEHRWSEFLMTGANIQSY